MGRVADFFREQSITLDGQKKSKMLSLDLEFDNMQAEIQVLKNENLRLKAQVNPLQREVDRFKEQIEQVKSSDHMRLDEVAETILTMIANTDLAKEQIAERLKLSKAKGDHNFDVLEQHDFAIAGSADQVGTYWTATPAGRAYLAKRGLL